MRTSYTRNKRRWRMRLGLEQMFRHVHGRYHETSKPFMFLKVKMKIKTHDCVWCSVTISNVEQISNTFT